MKRLIMILFAIPLMASSQEVFRMQTAAAITVQNNAEVTVQGGVVLENGSSLQNNGKIVLKRNGSSGTADWSDNTVTGYNHGSGTVLFNSSGTQSILSNNRFGTIEVENAGLTLNSVLRSSNWILTTGIVTTGTHSVHVLGTASNAINEGTGNANFQSSWVNGTMRRYIAPSAVNSYRFPVGNSVRVNMSEMTNLNSNPMTGISYIDASFGSKPGSDAGLSVSEQGTTYVSVNNGGVWYLTPDAVPGSGTYDLLLYFNGFTGLQDNSFGILRRPDVSANAAQWHVPAGSILPPANAPGRKVSDGFARRNNISGFSQFGIGQTSFALPVEIIDFSAKRISVSSVNIVWSTVSEQGNKAFEIQRSLGNSDHFVATGYVPTKAVNGNSTGKLLYHWIDTNNYSGVSYYRIRQIDLDGTSSFTSIRSVKGETARLISVWPNPANDILNIQLSLSVGEANVTLFDMAGRAVCEKRLRQSAIMNIKTFPPGLYTVIVMDATGRTQISSERIVIIR